MGVTVLEPDARWRGADATNERLHPARSAPVASKESREAQTIQNRAKRKKHRQP